MRTSAKRLEAIADRIVSDLNEQAQRLRRLADGLRLVDAEEIDAIADELAVPGTKDARS